MVSKDIFEVEAFVAAARGCLGTPFHHQGRKKFVGLDCIGLVVVALKAVGFEVFDRLDYGLRPDGCSLVRGLEQHGALQVSDIQKGDILLFRYDYQPQHVAIATSENTLIHAFAPVGNVVKTNIGFYWKNRLVGIYRLNFEMKDRA